MKIAKGFKNVSGKLRTASEWARIEDEHDELARMEEEERDREFYENDMMEYMGMIVPSEYVEQMIRY